MPALTQIRISSAAIGKLDELAERKGRSKEEVAGEILEHALQGEGGGRSETARRIRSMTPNVPQTDSTEIIRSLRDE